MRDGNGEDESYGLADAINTAETLALAFEQALANLRHLNRAQAGEIDVEIGRRSSLDGQTEDFSVLHNQSKTFSEVEKLCSSGFGALNFAKQALGQSRATVHAEAKDKKSYLMATSDTMKIGPMTKTQAMELVKMIQVKASVMDESGKPILVSNTYRDERENNTMHSVDFAGGQPDITLKFKDGLALTFDPYKCKSKDIDEIKSKITSSRYDGNRTLLLEAIDGSCKTKGSGALELDIPAFIANCSVLPGYEWLSVESINTASAREFREETEYKVTELVDLSERPVVNEIPTTRGISDNEQAVIDAVRGIYNGDNLSKVVEGLMSSVESLTTVTFSRVKGLSRVNNREGDDYKLWGGKNVPVRESFPKKEPIYVCEKVISNRDEVVDTLKVIVKEIMDAREELDTLLKMSDEDRTFEQNGRIENLQNRVKAQLPSLVKSHACDKTLLPEVQGIKELNLAGPCQTGVSGVFSRLVSGIFYCINPAKDGVPSSKLQKKSSQPSVSRS